MKRMILSLIIVALGAPIFAATVDIATGPLSFDQADHGFVARIPGALTESIGGKKMLPYLVYRFETPVERVEIVASEKVRLPGPLAIGRSLYRLSPGGAVPVVPPASSLVLPTARDFFVHLPGGDRRGTPVHEVLVYPLIPLSDTEALFIRAVRVSLKGAAVRPLASADGPLRSLIVVTSERTVASSLRFEEFVATKRRHGWTVDVATEAQYGADGLAGAKRAAAIREWLKGVYKKYGYVLLLGDPHPDSGDVPMLRTMVNEEEYDPSYHDVPTDFFYAELTTDWDSDGNGVYAQPSDKEFNFYWELVPGRIPVIGTGTVELDRILDRTIAYMAGDPSLAPHRRTALFPAAIPYYADQDGQYVPKMDGGYIVQYLESSFFSTHDDFNMVALVEKEGLDPSEFTGWGKLTAEDLVVAWNNGAGLVFWMGHGLPTMSVRSIWHHDNGDGIPSSYEISSEVFVAAYTTPQLPGDMASFVYMGSCLNGDVDEPYNLAYTMLRDTAVGVAASSQVSYGVIFSEYDPSQAQDVFAYGTVFSQAVLEGRSPALELAEYKKYWSSRSVLKTMKMEINYFGDPTLSSGVRACVSDTDCDDGLFCNGVERCHEGYCGLREAPIVCPAPSAVCRTAVCDEATKGCLTVSSMDGVPCGGEENKCFDRSVCRAGACEYEGATDCSLFDGPCARGECDPATGACRAVPENEGESCDDGYHCTTGDTCETGECVGDAVVCSETADCRYQVCDESAEGACIALQDLGQNGKACETTDGLDGYCSYGECVAAPEDKDKEGTTGGGGCSMTTIGR